MDLNAPMIMGPNGTPIPMPPPGDVSRKRKKVVNDTESDSGESPAKVQRLAIAEESIQVEMPLIPPYPIFPGIIPLDITTLPQLVKLVGGRSEANNLEAELVLPIIPVISLPDPATLQQ